MTAASAHFFDLVGRAPAELDAGMRRGGTPDLDRLAGEEFRGALTAHWARRLGMQQFIKGFERHSDGRLLGYNRWVAQDGLAGEWAPPSRRFAFFAVTRGEPFSRGCHYPQALVLDYGAAGPRLAPWRPIRDALVRVEPGSDDLLLGRAFLALGAWRPSFTFFVLERLGPPAS